MQNIDFAKLISVKLDVSVIQDTLSLALQDIVTRITTLEVNEEKVAIMVNKN